jgi:hypothetical protein
MAQVGINDGCGKPQARSGADAAAAPPDARRRVPEGFTLMGLRRSPPALAVAGDAAQRPRSLADLRHKSVSVLVIFGSNRERPKPSLSAGWSGPGVTRPPVHRYVPNGSGRRAGGSVHARDTRRSDLPRLKYNRVKREDLTSGSVLKFFPPLSRGVACWILKATGRLTTFPTVIFNFLRSCRSFSTWRTLFIELRPMKWTRLYGPREFNVRRTFTVGAKALTFNWPSRSLEAASTKALWPAVCGYATELDAVFMRSRPLSRGRRRSTAVTRRRQRRRDRAHPLVAETSARLSAPA